MSDYQSTPMPQMVLKPRANEQASAWGGHEVASSSENMSYWKSVLGDYFQPSDQGGESCEGVDEATWVGLGGDNVYWGSNILFQDGTEIAGPAWYEIYGGSSDTGGEVDIGWNANPSDEMFFSTTYDASSENVHFYLEDETLGYGSDADVMSVSVAQDDTAEWIVERPSHLVGGSWTPYDLADYGTVAWFGAQMEDASGTWYDPPSGSSGVSNNLLSMVKGSDVLSTPSAWGDLGEFSDSWNACS